MVSRREFLLSLGLAACPLSVEARVGQVEIGVCRGSRDLENAVKYGFDYLEPAVAEIAEMDDKTFRDFKDRVLASPIRCESFNSFIRKLHVVGDDVHEDELRTYVETALDRCRELGVKVIVWGSASSRNLTPGYPRDRAWVQIQSFLRMAGDTARPRGITIAIEPLRKKESNIINTGAEALQLVREVHHPNVRMIIDYYHLREENEDPKVIWKARKEIVHFHFANPNGRVWPKSSAEDPEYARFFEMVKKIHFRGRISIEARGKFEEDAAASLAFFREELGQQ